MIPIRILDGGLGTCLESEPYNIHFSSATPLWSAHLLTSSPETLLEVHKAYATAGADVILTSTYQASLEGFAATPKKALISSELDADALQGARNNNAESESTKESYSNTESGELMRKAIPLARRAFADTRRPGKVALSLGAYGATMRPSTEYSGDYLPHDMNTCAGLAQWHRQRLEIFKNDRMTWDDVDYVAFETIPVLEEVRAVRRVMDQCNTGSDKKSWWISCVFHDDKITLPDGTSIDDLVQVMMSNSDSGHQQPWGIGINCTSVTKLEQLVLDFESAVQTIVDNPSTVTPGTHQDLPWLVLYPDGAQGLVYNTFSQSWEAEEMPNTTQPTVAWHLQVANVIEGISKRALWRGVLVGGCCKTTPDDIGRLRMRLIDLDLYSQYQ